MRRIAPSFPLVLAILTASWAVADRAGVFAPGGVQEQRLELPPVNADIARIFEQLDEKHPAALQWLLRREGADKLSYFDTEAIRFDIKRVTKVPVGDETWRLVECTYISGDAMHSSAVEYRACWPVTYVFDTRGRLRDWVDDYDVAVLRDINGDGQVELVADLDSAKRVIVYTYKPGRSRELLRVDGVPEHGELLESKPQNAGGQYNTCEKPVEIIVDPAAPAARLKVAQHGLYKWVAKQQRYVNESAAPG